MQNRTGSITSDTRQRLKRLLVRVGRALAPIQPCTPPARSAAPEYPSQQENELALERQSQRFRQEMFGHLLRELPAYRARMTHAFNSGDYRSLADIVHQMLGAAAYCDALELETGLRRLRLALRSNNHHVIAAGHARANEIIDSMLMNAGCPGR